MLSIASAGRAIPLVIVGLDRVLLLRVWLPLRVATVLSIAKVNVLPLAVEASPVPPARVKLAAPLAEPTVLLSSAVTTTDEISPVPDPTETHPKAPLPSVFRTCPELPSAAGSVQIRLEVMASGALKPT
tara:strand:+ start:236 stop:622 length:387 start_codon:yes stop_codon:yes gene_type:complete